MIAKRKTLYSILTKVMTLYGPEYRIIKEKKAYKEFIVLNGNDSAKILDTLSGHIKNADDIFITNKNSCKKLVRCYYE